MYMRKILWPNCDACDHVAEYRILVRPRKVFGFWVSDPEATQLLCEKHFVEVARNAVIEYNKKFKIEV